MRVLPVIAVIATVLLLPQGALAKVKPPLTKSPRLWATINVCGTEEAPTKVGVRVSMPGSGKKAERMYVRIALQYRDDATQRWKAIGPAADSGWLGLGSSKYLRRETGRSFTLSAPATGQTFTIRGFVRYEWRIGKAPVRRTTRVTSGRINDVIGADPPGYSAGVCFLTGV